MVKNRMYAAILAAMTISSGTAWAADQSSSTNRDASTEATRSGAAVQSPANASQTQTPDHTGMKSGESGTSSEKSAGRRYDGTSTGSTSQPRRSATPSQGKSGTADGSSGTGSSSNTTAAQPDGNSSSTSMSESGKGKTSSSSKTTGQGQTGANSPETSETGESGSAARTAEKLTDRNRSQSQRSDQQRLSEDADGAMRGRSDTGVRSNAHSDRDGRDRNSSTRYEDGQRRDLQGDAMDRNEPRYSDRAEPNREYQRNERRSEPSYRDGREDRTVHEGRRYQGDDDRRAARRADVDDSVARRGNDTYDESDRDRSSSNIDRRNGGEDRSVRNRPRASNDDRYEDRYDDRNGSSNSNSNSRSSDRARYDDDSRPAPQYRADRYESGPDSTRGPRDNVANPRESYRSSRDWRSQNQDNRNSVRGQSNSEGRDSLTQYNNMGDNDTFSRGDGTSGNRNVR